MKQKINIPISKTLLTNNDIKEVMAPLKSGWLVQGPKVKEFEKMWANFTNSKFAIAVTSCTSALELSLVALNLQPNDEIIIPAFTWISTANVIEHLKCKVVFCDIDLKTFNIDLNQIEKIITKKTKAIIPVHLFGLACNMELLNKIKKKYSLHVIEDAACGFGSYYKNKHVGTFGDTGCFSFHPRKSITTGEGGMITTQNKKLAEKLICLRDHGALKNDLERHLGPKPFILSDHSEAGYNFRMTDIQASLGLSQMKRAKRILNERIKIANYYNNHLSHLEWLSTPSTDVFYKHGYQSYPCLFRPFKENIKKNNILRNKFMEYLQKNGISTRPATHSVHMLKYYKKKYRLKPKDFPNSWFANDCSVSLPLFNGMTKSEQDFIIEKILCYNDII